MTPDDSGTLVIFLCADWHASAALTALLRTTRSNDVQYSTAIVQSRFLLKCNNEQLTSNSLQNLSHIPDTNNSAFLVFEEDLEHELKLVKMVWETVLIEELYHHMMSPVVLHIVL